MAFRAAVNTSWGVAGVIAVGGDVPPEVTPNELSVCRQCCSPAETSDDWYTKEQFDKDEQRLRHCSVRIHALTLSAGHEWSGDLLVPASQFLRERYPSGPKSRAEYCWSHTDKSRLVKMVEDGREYDEIAAQIGRTAAACRAMYNLLTKRERLVRRLKFRSMCFHWGRWGHRGRGCKYWRSRCPRSISR